MNKLDPRYTLQASILLLEGRQEMQWQILKEQLNVVKEQAQPLNMIKGVWNDMRTSPDLVNNLATGAISLAAGYLSKKIVIGASKNPIRKLTGFLLQTAVAIIVARKPEIVEGIVSIVKGQLNKKEEQT